ncbi:MAG: hypothetical protein NTW03_17830 [Verrucomicrobia bacterium]|nr:hypothetical protein [Verrucomicrobiota bacterium]
MNLLTSQQQKVLCCILLLLLTGWAVKTYRAAHPPAQVALPSVR